MTSIRTYLDAWHGALRPHRKPDGDAAAATCWQRLEETLGFRWNVDPPQAPRAAKTDCRAPR